MSLKEIVAEKSGNFSCARVMAVVITLACILWTTIALLKGSETIHDMPLQYAALAATLYVANKIVTKFGTAKETKEQP